MENTDTKQTKLEIDGVTYNVTSVRKNKKSSPERDEIWTKKFKENAEKQDVEIKALQLMLRNKFSVEDTAEKRYCIELFIRGAPDSWLHFTLPPEYPSDAPPVYSLNAPWVRKSQMKELFQELTKIYSDNFGECIIHLWIKQINVFLKKEIQEVKKGAGEVTEEQEKPPVVVADVSPKDSGLKVYAGTPIWDRGSCFSPYLVRVASELEVQQALAKIESCHKVSAAWRNTFAYRYRTEGKIVEFEEDGGEPKAGKNLLQRLISIDAVDVLVFLSRRFGGRLLGSDRYRHLNSAADDVLIACGFKTVASRGQKDKKKSSSQNAAHADALVSSSPKAATPSQKTSSSTYNQKYKNKKEKTSKRK